MNFLDAFGKTNQPAAPAATATAQFMQASISQENKSFMNDDMKAYIDAKFEALKSDLIAAQTVDTKGTNKTVETPQETSGQDAIIRPEEEKPVVDSTIENK